MLLLFYYIKKKKHYIEKIFQMLFFLFFSGFDTTSGCLSDVIYADKLGKVTSYTAKILFKKFMPIKYTVFKSKCTF